MAEKERKRPHSAVKDIEEASTTPRVKLIGQSVSSRHGNPLSTVKPNRPLSPPTYGTSFLPVVGATSAAHGRGGGGSNSTSNSHQPGKERKQQEQRRQQHQPSGGSDMKVQKLPSKHGQVSLSQSNGALPVLLPNPNNTGSMRWMEDGEDHRNQLFVIREKSSKTLDHWPPDLSHDTEFTKLLLAVPKTNGKLKIQVRRMRNERKGESPERGTPHASSTSGFGLFVHAFRLPSRAEGVLRLGDEVISAYGVSLVDESPKLFARLLSENPHGDFVELTIKRRDLSHLFAAERTPLKQPEAHVEQEEDDQAQVPIPRHNNQMSPAMFVEPEIVLEDDILDCQENQSQPISSDPAPEVLIYAEPPQSAAEDPTSKVEDPTAKVEDPTSKVEDPTAKVPAAEEPTAKVEDPTPKVPAAEEPASEVPTPPEPITELTASVPLNAPNRVEETPPPAPATVHDDELSPLARMPIFQSKFASNRDIITIRKPSELLSLAQGSVESSDGDTSTNPSPDRPQDRKTMNGAKAGANKSFNIAQPSDDDFRYQIKSNESWKSPKSPQVVRYSSFEKKASFEEKECPQTSLLKNFSGSGGATPQKSRALSDDYTPPPPATTSQRYFTPQVQGRKSFANKNNNRPHSSDSRSYGRSRTAIGLTLLHNLSKTYTRAEARAEGQCLSIALKQIDQSGRTIVELAARKIQVWAKLTIPRKQFLRRMDNRNFVRSILFNIGDKACIIGEKRVKTRQGMLKMAAAIQIQRHFRVWRRDFLFNVLRIQSAWRRAIIRVKVRKFVTIVRAGVLIYRYIQKHNKKYIKLGRPKRMKLLCKIMKRYIDYIGFEVRRKQQAEFLQRYQLHGNAMGSALLQGRRRYIETSKRENAVIKLQSLLRGYRARSRVMEIKKSRRAMQAFRSAVMIFLIRMKGRRRVKETAAAVKLQKRFRGMKERTNMYRRIVAGIKITQAWFKYRQYVKLKEYCRRIIRPLKITLSDIENIPSQSIYSGSLKIKLSVWWSPLLHLMGAKDYGTVVNSKRPQFIYKTQLKSVVLMNAKKQKETEEAEQKAKRTYPSFYSVASLRLAVEKSVSIMDNEVYIGQSFPDNKLKPSVPFSVIKGEENPAPECADESKKTNWDEISGNGDKFENLSQNIAALPVIPRRSSLRKSNESIPSLSGVQSSLASASAAAPAAPTLEAVAASAAVASNNETPPPPRPELTRTSSGGSESPSQPRRKVSFDSTNLQRVEPASKNESDSVSARALRNSISEAEPPEIKSTATAPVTPPMEAEKKSSATTDIALSGISSPHASLPGEEKLSVSEEEKRPKRGQEEFSHLQDGVDMLKKNPVLLRHLSRRISRARIAAEYRNEDTAEEMAQAAKEHSDSLGPMRSVASGATSPNKGRKASVFGKISGDLANLFGGDARKSFINSHIQRPRFDSEMRMGCNFDDEVINIPGCHGNSVLKIEVFDGDRKFGSSLFHLSAHDQLMFWGGDYEQEIELFKSRRLVNLDVNTVQDSSSTGRNSNLGGVGMKPILKLKVQGGTALHSKCDWCRAIFKAPGSSPGRGFISALFDKWKKYYISLDGSFLRFLESKNSVEAQYTISVVDIKSYKVVLSGIDRMAAKQVKSAFVEDGYFFIISTASREDIYIKFADSHIREDWEFTLDQIFEKRRKMEEAAQKLKKEEEQRKAAANSK